jgi:hypothetical protein
MAATKRIFVTEAQFEKMTPHKQRSFTDFILGTGVDYFPHAQEVQVQDVHIPLKDNTVQTVHEEKITDYWEMKLEDFDMSILQIKYPDSFVIRKMEEYPYDFESTEPKEEFAPVPTTADEMDTARADVRYDFHLKNTRPFSDMLKAHVTNGDLYDLAEKEQGSQMMHRIKGNVE